MRKRLDKKRPFGTVYGMPKYTYEQDGLCFDGQGLECTTQGKPIDDGKPEPTEDEPEVETAAAPAAPGPEDDPDAPLAVLKARYLQVAGKAPSAGVSKADLRNMIKGAL